MIKYKNYLSKILLVTFLSLGLFSFNLNIQAQEEVDENEVTLEENTDQDQESEVEVGTGEEDEVINSDQTESFESNVTEDEEEVEDEEIDYGANVEVTEEEVSGEVTEIGDDYVIVTTEDGEERTISLGGGGLLSPFVRSVQSGDIAVGDKVELTIATEVTTTAEVVSVDELGNLVVTASNGQTQSISPNDENIIVRQNGEQVTDFSTLVAGDEVELVLAGEVISDIEKDDSLEAGSWVVPLVIILIVLALAALLAKRNRRIS